MMAAMRHRDDFDGLVRGTCVIADMLGCSERTVRAYIALSRELGVELPFTKMGKTSPLATTREELFRWFAALAKAREARS